MANGLSEFLAGETEEGYLFLSFPDGVNEQVYGQVFYSFYQFNILSRTRPMLSVETDRKHKVAISPRHKWLIIVISYHIICMHIEFEHWGSINKVSRAHTTAVLCFEWFPHKTGFS
jgi:hypothetical protein